ncbi:hypothetical protein ACTFIY_006716 [Dictyostelium cf. discoideum]
MYKREEITVPHVKEFEKQIESERVTYKRKLEELEIENQNEREKFKREFEKINEIESTNSQVSQIDKDLIKILENELEVFKCKSTSNKINVLVPDKTIDETADKTVNETSNKTVNENLLKFSSRNLKKLQPHHKTTNKTWDQENTIGYNIPFSWDQENTIGYNKFSFWYQTNKKVSRQSYITEYYKVPNIINVITNEDDHLKFEDPTKIIEVQFVEIDGYWFLQETGSDDFSNSSQVLSNIITEKSFVDDSGIVALFNFENLLLNYNLFKSRKLAKNYTVSIDVKFQKKNMKHFIKSTVMITIF